MDTMRFFLPEGLFRFRALLLVMTAGCLLCAGGLEALAASRYGTPLQFEPPPVDLGDYGGQADEPADSVAPPPEPDNPPGSPGERGVLRPRADSRERPDATAPNPGAGENAATGQAPKPIRLFGTVEFRSPIKDLPKWERVRGLESKKPSFVNGAFDVHNKKVAERWSALRDKLAGASLMEQARQVNVFFNQWPYKTDREVWGVEDYWATPREFVQKSGDCEDYAISKYYALRDLGVPASQLRIAAVKDTIRNLGHAVLVVFVDGDAYLLDNLSNLVLSHAKLKHYAPQYTVNEQYLWRHVKPKSTPGGKK